MDYQKLYEENADFKLYVDRYCTTYKCNKEKALSYVLVQQVGDYYAEKREAVTVTKENSFGC